MMSRKSKSQKNLVAEPGKKIRYGNDLTPLISDFLHACDEMRKQYEGRLKAWEAKKKTHEKDPAMAHPGPKPKMYPFIRNTADLERILEVERVLGAQPTNLSECRTKAEQIEFLMNADPEVRERIAETWRFTRDAELRWRKGVGAGEHERRPAGHHEER